MFIPESEREELLRQARNLPDAEKHIREIAELAADGLASPEELLRQVIEMAFDYRSADPLGTIQKLLWIEAMRVTPISVLTWAADLAARTPPQTESRAPGDNAVALQLANALSPPR